MPWSIGDEIVAAYRAHGGAGRRPSLDEAVRALDMIDVGDRLVDVVELRPWERGGAETYVYHFALRTAAGEVRFIAKACVSPPGAGTLTEVLAQWHARRRLLAEHGVAVPKVFASINATVIEEFIPHSLASVLREHERAKIAAKSEEICRTLGATLAVLTKLGFMPVSLHDLRSRGNDVVLVDFGQDLGPPHMATCGSQAPLVEMLEYLEREGIDLAGEQLSALAAGFEAELGDEEVGGPLG